MATCSACEKEKDSWEFVSARGKVTKQCAKCRERGRRKAKTHYDKNAEREIKRVKRWRAQNPDVHKRAERSRRKRNGKSKEARKRQNQRYRKRYPEKNNARVMEYNARKLKATPAWADRKEMQKIYELAALMRKLTKDVVHVDHIVPLKSDQVCGLHCQANLRIVVGTYNSRKSNKTWPDMW